MMVSDLIEVLSKFPPDASVFIGNGKELPSHVAAILRRGDMAILSDGKSNEDGMAIYIDPRVLLAR